MCMLKMVQMQLCNKEEEIAFGGLGGDEDHTAGDDHLTAGHFALRATTAQAGWDILEGE